MRVKSLVLVLCILNCTVSGDRAGSNKDLATMANSLRQRFTSECCPEMRRNTPLIRAIESGHYLKNRFKNKVLLVTGGARGLGRAVAIRAAKEGANIVLVDTLQKDGTTTESYLKSMGVNALFVQADVTVSLNWTNIIKATTDVFGRIDYAVNCAAVIDDLLIEPPSDYLLQKAHLPQRIHLAKDPYWDRVMDVNINGMFKAMRAELSQMMKQRSGGAIVNVGSVDGMIGTSDNPAYVASKHAVCGLTRSAAIDYAKFGIRINSVNMAATDTPMLNRQNFLLALRRRANIVSPMISVKENSLLSFYEPFRRPSTVWEQVSTILYLLTPDASHITGSNMATDGGWSAY